MTIEHGLMPTLAYYYTMLTGFQMKNRIFPWVCLCSFFLTMCFQAGTIAYSQNIQWERNYGGSGADGIFCIQQTMDGGYILAGSSESNDHDVSGHYGGTYDYWVVKVSSSGVIQWEQNYGGSNNDVARSIRQTKDKGYIVLGSSSSSDWDVSVNHGDQDYWVIKIDSFGVIQWEQNYGGSQYENASDIDQSPSGGYLIAGSSESMDNDVTSNYGEGDIWIVKTDSFGKIEWEQNFGGSDFDYVSSIKHTSDRGFILAGSSRSSDGDVSGNFGGFDYWMVKLDSVGNIQWEQNYGGSQNDRARSIELTSDGGYILAGLSASNDHDVSGNNGYMDYWVVKLDSLGAIQWEQNYGGSGADFAWCIQQTSDLGYFVGGESMSGDIDVTNNYGGYDFWIMRLDASGNIKWQQNFGGSQSDFLRSSQISSNGQYIAAGLTQSNDNDVSNNYGGFSDIWLLKLDDVVGIHSDEYTSPFSLKPNPTQGPVFIDLKRDHDFIEVSVINIVGQVVKQDRFMGTSNLTFDIEGPTGIYLVRIQLSQSHSIFIKVLKQ